MSFFFMPHSLSITFQFHCLENKALIHHHVQFSTLTFGWTFFSLKMQMHTLLQGLLSFESNLIMIATSSVISQKLDVSTSAPFSFPDVRETVLLPSSSWLIWSLCFSFSIHPSWQFTQHIGTFQVSLCIKVKKKNAGDYLILGIKNIENCPVQKMIETEDENIEDCKRNIIKEYIILE